MKKQYYTPDIEDIRVGYECEQLLSIIGEFDQKIPDPEWRYSIIDNIRGLDKEWLQGIRTPYLTKEQIEAEGWKQVNEAGIASPGMDFLSMPFEKNGYWLFFGRNNNIYISELNGVYCCFTGKCPSINELRYISKLLGI